jgi:hypothetical protein
VTSVEGIEQDPCYPPDRITRHLHNSQLLVSLSTRPHHLHFEICNTAVFTSLSSFLNNNWDYSKLSHIRPQNRIVDNEILENGALFCRPGGKCRRVCVAFYHENSRQSSAFASVDSPAKGDDNFINYNDSMERQQQQEEKGWTGRGHAQQVGDGIDCAVEDPSSVFVRCPRIGSLCRRTHQSVGCGGSQQ